MAITSYNGAKPQKAAHLRSIGSSRSTKNIRTSLPSPKCLAKDPEIAGDVKHLGARIGITAVPLERRSV